MALPLFSGVTAGGDFFVFFFEGVDGDCGDLDGVFSATPNLTAPFKGVDCSLLALKYLDVLVEGGCDDDW